MAKTRIKIAQDKNAVELTLTEVEAYWFAFVCKGTWLMNEPTKGRDVYFQNGPSDDPAKFNAWYWKGWIELGEESPYTAGHDAKPDDTLWRPALYLFDGHRQGPGWYIANTRERIGRAKLIYGGRTGLDPTRPVRWQGIRIPSGQNMPEDQFTI